MVEQQKKENEVEGMDENTFGLNAGHVTLNGVEVFRVKDIQLHAMSGRQTEITMIFNAPSQDVAYSEPPKQQPE